MHDPVQGQWWHPLSAVPADVARAREYARRGPYAKSAGYFEDVLARVAAFLASSSSGPGQVWERLAAENHRVV